MIRVIIIACVYAAAIFAAEMTLGNAAFPLHFWYFTATPAWQWSVPVHGAGFLWMATSSRVLRHRPAIIPIIASWAFFAAAETANLLWLRLFDYSSEPFGVKASCAAVLVLYALLCGAAVYALRIIYRRNK